MAAPMKAVQRIHKHAWRNFFTNKGRGLLSTCPAACHTHRTILSDSYRAEDTWQRRKRLDVNMDDLRLKLDHDLVTLKQPVPSVELQMFIDNIINEDELKVSEKYLYSFRHTPVAHHLRPYTIHSWLRVCLDFHQPLRALAALQDKTHYGLFPDTYTFNLLLDHFIRENDFQSAFLVARELMLIEVMDETTPLAQALSLYVCHRLLKDNAVPEDLKYDFGMTLADATRNSPSCLSRSYHIIGYCMTGKLKPVSKVMEQWASIDGDKIITQEAAEHLWAALDNEENTDEVTRPKLKGQLEMLETSGKVADSSLDELVEATLLPQIPAMEEEDIKRYPELLRDWHRSCEEAIEAQAEEERAMERAAKEARLEKLQEEVGGVEYWIQKARKEGKEVKDTLLEERIERP